MPKGGNIGAITGGALGGLNQTNRALNFRPNQPPVQNNNLMAPYGNPWGPSNPGQMMQPRMPQMQFPGQTPPIQPQQGGIGGMMGLNPMLIQFLQMLNQQQQLSGGQGGYGNFGGMAKPQPVPMGEQPQSDVPAQGMGPSPDLMGRFLGRKVFEQ